MLADGLDYVVGVDTHRDEHVIAVVAAPAGAVVAGAAAAACDRGYRELVAMVEQHAAGRRVWAVEGTGSYGAGLSRFLIKRGEVVLEVSRAPRPQTAAARQRRRSRRGACGACCIGGRDGRAAAGRRAAGSAALAVDRAA